MTSESSKRRAPRIAVGSTRERAARFFGQGHDDIFLTSFTDFDAEVDLADVAVVEVVAGEGMAATVQSVATAQLAGRSIALRTTVPTDDPSAFLALLHHLGLEITGVGSLGGPPVLGLAPRGSTTTGTEELVLQALRASAADSDPTAAQDTHVARGAGPAPSKGGSHRSGPTSRSAPRPVPRLVNLLGLLERLGTGRRVLTGVVAAFVVALVGLGLLADKAGAGLSVILPVIGLVVVAVGASCYVTLLLARQVNVQTGRIERAVLRNRKVVQKRVGSLEKRTAALNERIAALEKAQSRFPFALEYLEALGELGAETSGRVRDLTEALAESRRSTWAQSDVSEAEPS